MIGGVGKSPFKQLQDEDYISDNNIYDRQQYRESTFDGSAVSPAGATSIAQITRTTFEYGLKHGYVPKGTKYEDLAKDDALAEQFQIAYMEDLMTRDWNKAVNNGELVPDEVIVAKALGAYNAGPTRFVNILNAMKADGIDIYSIDFVEKLNEYHLDSEGNQITETKDYISDIVIGGDEQWESDFEGAYEDYHGSPLPRLDNSPLKQGGLGGAVSRSGKSFLESLPGYNIPKWLETKLAQYLVRNDMLFSNVSEHDMRKKIIDKMMSPGYRARLSREVTKNQFYQKNNYSYDESNDKPMPEPLDYDWIHKTEISKETVNTQMAHIIQQRLHNIRNTEEYWWHGISPPGTIGSWRGKHDHEHGDHGLIFYEPDAEGMDTRHGMRSSQTRLHEWYHAVTHGDAGILGYYGDWVGTDLDNISTAELLFRAKSSYIVGESDFRAVGDGDQTSQSIFEFVGHDIHNRYLSNPTEVYARLNVVHDMMQDTKVPIRDSEGRMPGDKGWTPTFDIIWDPDRETEFTLFNLEKLHTYLESAAYKNLGGYDDIVEFFGVDMDDPRQFDSGGEGINLKMDDRFIMEIMNNVASNEDKQYIKELPGLNGFEKSGYEDIDQSLA
jgi:hypothetical protein